MNFTKILLVSLLFAGTSTAFGASTFLDDAGLDSCTSDRGKIELRRAGNDDLSIKLVGLNTNRCDTLRFIDNSSNRIIKEYDIKGTSYTLSKSQLNSLSSDCRLNVQLHGDRGRENYVITINWCTPVRQSKPQSSQDAGFSFALSGKRNCKIMKNGNYTNDNIENHSNLNRYDFCQDANKGDVVTYDWSGKKNCKLMINNGHIRNVADVYCTTKF